MSPLTDDQRAAVEDLRRNTCVTSGAGCGKTRVLVERYVRFLDEMPDLALERLAAITFTENAAAEMRDRIRKACRDRIDQARRAGDPVRLGRWLERYWDVDVAPINTIHGFCASLLRQYPIEAGVDPGFDLLDEAEAALLVDRLVTVTIENLLDADDPDAETVLAHFDLRTLRSVLADLVRDQREKLERIAAPALAASDVEILRALEAEVGEEIRRATDEALDSAAVADAARTVASLSGEVGDRMEETRAAVDDALRRLRTARTPEIAAEAVETICGANLRGGSAKKWPSKEALKEAKDAVGTLRDTFRKVRARFPPFDEAAERAHLAVARALDHTARVAIERYDVEKRRRSVLDFEDLQVLARDLLRRDRRVLDACRARFRAILVDELQDTNALQFEIVERLASKGGRGGAMRNGAFFGVGDPKQSIYRFRGAEVEVFDEARDRVGPDGRKPLVESWRLSAGLADLVNDLFSPLMGEAYEPIEGLQPPVNDPPAECLVITNPEDDEGWFRSEEGHLEEARALAARIQAAVSDGDVQVRDSNTETARPARWGDVAILFRRMSFLHLYEEALERQGVPYTVVSGGGFYKQQEVLDVLAALRVIDDPDDHLNLAGLLRSPFFAVSDEGLWRLGRAGPDLARALERAAEIKGLEEEDLRGAERAAARLAEWSALKDRLSLADLVDRVTFDSGYAAGAVGRFGGARAYANLRQMVELARRFEGEGLYALCDYIHYVTDFLRSEMRQEQASVEDPGGDTVRLMTIHKAKGLEFPIVVVPDLARSLQPPRDPVLLHPITGLAVRLRDEESDAAPSCALALARAADARAARAESLRLLYVATTRAKDYLILAGARIYNRSRAATWLEQVLAAFGAGRDEADAETPTGGNVKMVACGPVQETVRRDARRVGPRGIFEGGRVVWSALRARRESAPAGRIEETLARIAPLPRLAFPPARVTATDLNTYAACPRRYLWTRVLGVDTPAEPRPDPATGLTPAGRGKLLHRALELAGPSEEAVEAAVTGALREAPPAPPTVEDARRRAAEEALAAFRASDLGRRVAAARRTEREMPVLLALDATRVAGTVDLVFEDADGRWELVDHKSGRPSTEEDAAEGAERYRLQLGLYALALARWLGRPPAAWSVYFLDSAVTHRHSLATEDLKAVESEAREALRGMAAGRFEPGPRQACDRCRFQKVCGDKIQEP